MSFIGAHPLSSSASRSLEGTCSRMNIWRRRETHEILPIDRHSGTLGSPMSPSNTLDCTLQNNTKKGHHVAMHLTTSHYRRDIIPSRRDAFEAPGSPILSSRGSSDFAPSATSLWLDEYANSGLQAHLATLCSDVFVRCGTPDKNNNNGYCTQHMEAQHDLPFVFDPFGFEDYSTSSILHGNDGMAGIPGRDDDPIVPRDIAEQRPPVAPIAPPSSLEVLNENWIQDWANDVYRTMMDNEMDVPFSI